MSAWIRSHPYTACLIAAAIFGAVTGADAAWWGYKSPDAIGLAFGLGMIIGAGWIARWTR